MPSLFEIVRSNEVIPCEESNNPFILNIRIAKTESFYQYVEAKPALPHDEENIFGHKESSIGLYLAQELIKKQLCSNVSVYQTNLVVYLGVIDKPEVLHIINQFVTESVLSLHRLYNAPKVLVNLYNPPAAEVILYQRYWQMCWFAHLRRCLGEVYKPHISRYNREYQVKEIQKEFEQDPDFSWDNLSDNLKYGYQFINGRLQTRNFCSGTGGDLF